MTTYNRITTGTNLSELVQKIESNNDAIRCFERTTVSALPGSPVPGQFVAVSDQPSIGPALLYRDPSDSTWKMRLDLSHAAINAGGSVAFTAAQNMGGNALFGLPATPLFDDWAVRSDWVVARNGSRTLTADWNVGNRRITGLLASTAADGAARVDQCQPAGAGLYRYFPDCQIATSSTGLPADEDPASFQAVTGGPESGGGYWTPREVQLFVLGEVRRQSDNGLVGDAGIRPASLAVRLVGAPLTQGEIYNVLEFALGGITVRVQVEFKSSGTPSQRGFFVRIFNASTGAYLKATVKAVARGGV